MDDRIIRISTSARSLPGHTLKPDPNGRKPVLKEGLIAEIDPNCCAFDFDFTFDSGCSVRSMCLFPILLDPLPESESSITSHLRGQKSHRGASLCPRGITARPHLAVLLPSFDEADPDSDPDSDSDLNTDSNVEAYCASVKTLYLEAALSHKLQGIWYSQNPRRGSAP